MLDTTSIIIGVLGGFAAGVINLLSGSGSIITLSLMAFLGVSPDVANGTNRIGILTHGTKGSYDFYKRGDLSIKGNWKIIIFSLIGAIFGTLTALKLSPDDFNFTMGLIFLFLLITIIFKPEQYLKKNKKLTPLIPWLMIPIGFYGGFIQVGCSLFILAVLHLLSGKTLKDINPLKLFIITLFNIPALILFGMGDKINWPLGISLAVGQYFGAYIGVKLNSSQKNIEPYLKVLLIVLIIVSIAKFWKFI